MVKIFFFASGCVQLLVGALARTMAEEQVSFLLLCQSLRRRLCACGRQEKRFVLCTDFSRALRQEEGLDAS